MVLSAFSLPLTGPMTTRFQPLLVVIRELKPSKANCARTVSACSAPLNEPHCTIQRRSSFSPPSVLAAAFHLLSARPAAFSAERRWYAQVFAVDPDTAVGPQVLAAPSAAVPVRLAQYAFAAAGTAVPLPVGAAVEPAVGCYSTAAVAPDAAAFAGVVQQFVRSMVLR